MIVTTSQEAIAISTCCACALPECSEPRKECQSVDGEVYVSYQILETAPDWKYFQTLRYEYEGGGFRQYRSSQTFDAYLGGTNASVATTEYTTGEPTVTPIGVPLHLEPIDLGSARDAGKAALLDALDWESEDLSFGETCNSKSEIFTPGPFLGTELLTTTISRYRFGVPADYSTIDVPRSTWDMQWDEVFFPKVWDEWNTARIEYEAWLAGGSLPPAVDPPGDEPTSPSLIASKTWNWTGSMESPWSEWFQLDIPKGTGEIRACNVLTICYRSTRIGQKPTSYGEVWTPNPPTQNHSDEDNSFNILLTL